MTTIQAHAAAAASYGSNSSSNDSTNTNSTYLSNAATNNSSNNNNNNSRSSENNIIISNSDKMTTMIFAEHHLQQQQLLSKQQQQQRLRRKQRRGGRLWQLPQTSIQEYAQWIQTKPLSDQSIAEQKFLWKYQRRLLIRRNKLPSERMRDYIGRLEQKEDKTPVETQLVQQFHLKKATRRKKGGVEGGRGRGLDGGRGLGGGGWGRPVGVPPPIFWRRNNNNNNTLQQQQQQLLQLQPQQSPEIPSGVLNMASLRESMNKLGLSTDKLRESVMDDAE